MSLKDARHLTRMVVLVSAISLLSSLLPVRPSSAETAATVETRTIVSGRALRGLSFSTSDKGWAVGSGGTLLSTQDTGATWTARSSGVSSDLLDVDFVDDLYGWAVGAGGTVLRTQDGGTTWVNQPTGLVGTFTSVEFVDRQHGWIIGSDPTLVSTILATDDGGLTWTRQVAQGAAGMLDVGFQDAKRGVAVGYLGSAFRTDDGGDTWLPIPMPEKWDWAFYSVAVEGNTTLIGAQFGVVLRSDDSGVTWSETNVMGELAIHTVTLDGDLAVAAGETGSLALSGDGGGTWTTLPTTTTATLRRAAIEGGRGFIVGDAGRLVTVTPDLGGPPALEGLPIFVGSDSCDSLLEPHLLDAPPTVALATVPADLDGNGDDEIVLATLDGLTALKPFSAPRSAELWRFGFHARVQDVAVAELDGGPGAELVGVTRRSRPERHGIFAVDSDGSLIWSKHVPGGLDRLEVADLNGDGLDDVAATGEARAVYFFDGIDGTLLANPRTVVGATTDVDVGDLTGDGLADVVVVTDESSISAFRGGDFARLWTHQVESSQANLRAVEVEDVDGDGVAEVAVAGHAAPSSLPLGSGDGSTSVGSRRGAYVGLFNGDGDLRWDFADPGTGTMRTLKLADLTGDGALDLVAHASRIDTGYVYALDGKGDDLLASAGEPKVLWSAATTREGINQFATSEAVIFGSISEDGLPDPIVAVSNGSAFAFDGAPDTAASVGRPPPGEVLWEFRRRSSLRTVRSLEYEGDSYGLLLSEDGLVTVLDRSTGERLWRFNTGRDNRVTGIDIDGDGIDEIGAASFSGRIVVVDSEGSELSAGDLYMPGSVVGFTATDVQDDGDEELVAADDLGNIWVIEPASGELLWKTTTSLEVTSLAVGEGSVLAGTRSGRVAGWTLGTDDEPWTVPLVGPVGYVEFDPALGFVAGSQGLSGATGNLVVLSSSGDIEQQTNVNAAEINIGNLDADPAPEIAIASGFSVRSYDSSLSLEWSLPLPGLVSNVALADIDGDGVTEVAATQGGSIVAIDGSTGRDLWEAPGGTQSVITAMDVQGDGDDEIVGFTGLYGTFGLIEVGGGNTLRVLDGDGSRLALCELVRGPKSVTSLDIDGDGFTEVISGGNSGGVYVFTAPGREGIPDPDLSTTPTPTPTQTPETIAVLELLDLTSEMVQFSDSATLAARLTESSAGLPLAGRDVTFMIEGRNGYRTFDGSTGPDGVVSLEAPINLRPGDFSLVATAQVSDGKETSSDLAPIQIVREDVAATLELTGSGSDRTLHAVLKDLDDFSSGVAFRVVRFYADGQLIGTSKTDAGGDAYLTLPKKSGKRFEVVFDGDDFFREARAEMRS